MRRIWLRTWANFGVVLCVVLGHSAMAKAGPTRYDPATKSFNFTYTYAALNPGLMGPQAIGASQNRMASNDQDAVVRALLQAVNQELLRATGGRASIARLERVSTIKEADVVISLTGNPGRAGWASMSAIEGRPGQIGLYYPYLEQQFKQDVVLTAVHEFCHYIFGLADEYDTTRFPNGCPRSHGHAGPGCIMDNYFLNGPRNGWYGRFCAHDHDSRPAQPQSCQAIVDKFFADRGVGPEEVDARLVTQGQRENLLESVRGYTFAEARANPGRPRSPALLRRMAERFLENLLQREKVSATQIEIDRVIESALHFATPNDARIPPANLAREHVDSLLHFARNLVFKYASEQSRLLRRKAIQKELFAFARDIPGIGGSPPDEVQRFLDQLAQDTASRSADEERFEKLVDAARLHIKFDQEIAVTTVEIATVLGIPGNELRRERIRDLQGEALRTLALPGRTVPRFGLRRTLIVAPDPIDPGHDAVLSQAGIFSYPDIRNRYVRQFARLVDRAKLLTPLVRGDEPSDRPLAVDDFRIQDAIEQARKNRADTPQNRLNRIQTILTRVTSLIADDQLENIILLVPPGGLGVNLGQKLETLRDQFVGKTDLRLDIVIVGSEAIPPELRDLCVRSGGSILTVTDIDEVGAIAQRLKNDQLGGSWVTIPRQGVLGSRPEDRANRADDPPDSGTQAAEALRRELRGEDPVPPAPVESTIALNQGRISVLTPTAQDDARLFLQTLFQRAPAEDEGPPLRAELTQILSASPYTEAIGLADPFPVREGPPKQLKDALTEILNAQYGQETLAEQGTLGERYVRFLAALDALQPIVHDDEFKASENVLPGDFDFPRAFGAIVRLRTALDSFNDSYVVQINRLVDSETSAVAKRNRRQAMENAQSVLQDLVRTMEDAIIPFVEYRPLFTRIDRSSINELITSIEYGERPAPPVETTRNGQTVIRLSRFYAEAEADFELILGLSRPVPTLVGGESLERPDVQDRLPRIALFSDPDLIAGTATQMLTLDTAASSETMLVYRFRQARGLGNTWVNAAMILDDDLMRRYNAAPVNFTFTVGSARENIQLTPALARRRIGEANEPLEELPPKPLLGSVQRSEGPVFLEVQVLGGMSIIGADVRGYLQRITDDTDPIELIELPFSDKGEGTRGDSHADDGIYTATIPLQRLSAPAEYRVIIVGTSTEASRNIAMDDPMEFATEEEKRIAAEVRREVQRIVGAEVESPDDSDIALQFQRATSFHFHVDPN